MSPCLVTWVPILKYGTFTAQLKTRYARKDIEMAYVRQGIQVVQYARCKPRLHLVVKGLLAVRHNFVCGVYAGWI